jgi:hypothetical protein
VRDFVLPHGDKILNGHVYHEENAKHHLPPGKLGDLRPVAHATRASLV